MDTLPNEILVRVLRDVPLEQCAPVCWRWHRAALDCGRIVEVHLDRVLYADVVKRLVDDHPRTHWVLVFDRPLGARMSAPLDFWRCAAS